MTTRQRWTVRAALLFGATVCFGCNPLLLPMFLQGESHKPPEVKAIADKDKKKEIKVAILTSSRLDARAELINVDRDLSQKTAKYLRDLAANNEDKIVVIEPRKVEQYLTNHPGWKDMDPADLAADLKRFLKVDYVIDIEITSMSLFEQGNHDIYKARGDLHVTLWNTNNDDDGPYSKEIHGQYPSDIEFGKPVDRDTNLMEFRGEFLGILAKEISYCFLDHPTINEMDPSRKRFAD